METEGTDEFRRKAGEARSLMERALAILDEIAMPAQVAAHLDMAISSLDSATTKPPVNRMDEPPYPPESCAWPIRPAA